MKTTTLLLLTIFACLGSVQAQMVKKPLDDKIENEYQPKAPGEDYTWVNGHWTWDNNDYAWVDGAYEETKSDHEWVDGEWERDKSTGAWFYSEGFWTPVSQGMTVVSNNLSINTSRKDNLEIKEENSSTEAKPTLGAMFK